MNTGKTSVNTIAAGFKKVPAWPGQLNFDYGGGKYRTASEWLFKEKGVINLVYDKYNKTRAENALALHFKNRCQTMTCFNVLNTMKSKTERNEVYDFAKALIGATKVYFTVYEGYKTEVGSITSKGWQNHRRLKTYLEEIEKAFEKNWEIKMYKQMITVSWRNEK